MSDPSSPPSSRLTFIDAGRLRTLAMVAAVMVPALVAWLLPQFIGDLLASATTQLHTILEVFYIGGATAIFGVAWYSPRADYRLRSTLVASACVPMGLFATLHLVTFPGMPAIDAEGGDASAHFALLTRMALPLALLALTLVPPASALSKRMRWGWLGIALAVTLSVAWQQSVPVSSAPSQLNASILDGLVAVPEAIIAACLLVAFVAACRHGEAKPESNHLAIAGVFAGLAEACAIANPGDMGIASALDMCAHAYGLLALAATFLAVYGQAVDAPYRALEQARATALLDKERLETIIHSIADGVVVVDANMAVACTNPVAALLFGATSVDAPPGHAEPLHLLAEAVGAGAILTDVESCLRDGRTRTAMAYSDLCSRTGLHSTVEHSVSPIRDGSGRVQGAVLVLRDVTTRKAMEQLLIGREEQFRTLAENSPDIIVRYDRACRCIYANATYHNVTGTAARSVLLKTPVEAAPLPSAQARALQDMLGSVIASRLGADLDLAWQRKNATHANYFIRAVPEFDDAGRVVSVLTVTRDITAIKDTERRLRESRAQLRELSARREEAREEERKRIARSLHEELGQILTALRFSISALSLQYRESVPELPERTRYMLGLLDKTIEGMRAAVTSLRPTTLDAGLTVGLEWLVHEFQASTSIECSLHVPEGDLQFDDARATAAFRIVQEALSNVARHSGASRADVVLRHEGSHWLIKVRDNGCGFDTKRPRDGGSGLHDMWERALMLNGGEFHVSSSRGLGTVVKVLFPAAP